MTVQTNDVIVLVPGLLGFGSFGPEGAPILEYFLHVKQELRAVFRDQLRLEEPRFFVHEPPPTGPLALRVASLVTSVERLTRELPHARIHLIGHSTGGVDTRLFVNLLYSPPEAPASKRQHLIKNVATVVSLSAPHAGAPFAAHAAPVVSHLLTQPVRQFIKILYLSSILNTARKSVPAHRALDEKRYVDNREFAAAVRQTAVRSMFMLPLDMAALIQKTTQLGPELARQVSKFLDLVVSDTRLLKDLQPAEMVKLNQAIAAGDTFPVHCFVSVSPAPRGLPLLPTQKIYALAYRFARPWFSKGSHFPDGEWLAGRDAALETAFANDGVVPSASQPAPAAPSQPPLPVRIVQGDHLDVVGHFAGVGETFFKSGANIDAARFSQLWSAVGRTLALPARGQQQAS
jgi:pimeloyl-ACP methyl ester carboxylesterase